MHFLNTPKTPHTRAALEVAARLNPVERGETTVFPVSCLCGRITVVGADSYL